MDKKDFLTIISEDRILEREPMKNYTTFSVGGPAKFLITVNNGKELADVLSLIKKNEEKYFLLGNGSNILVSDKGYDGVVIKLGGDFQQIETNEDRIKVGAGVTLSMLAKTAMQNSLTGLEFASGIPGTVGGALFMNAGAYGGEMKQVVTEVTAVDKEGNTVILDNAAMEFGYRTSSLKKNGLIALGCTVKLEKGDKDNIINTMHDLSLKRKEKQPLEYPSAGSTFKRPEGYFAGKLIEDSGLGGFCVGGAQVSEKHKGFVINRDNASAKDVKKLIDEVIQTVKDKQGVTLEPEVIFLGDF